MHVLFLLGTLGAMQPPVQSYCPVYLHVPVINAATFGMSFKEWKFCQFEIDRLRNINLMECPACEGCQQSVHVDGNMKLYRFKTAET